MSVVVIISGTTMETRGGGAAAATVTVAEADAPGNAVTVAMTVSVPPDEGAVYKPELEIVPPAPPVCTLHVTGALEVPKTVDVNCWVCPAVTDADVGEMLIVGFTVNE
jgi:hypothetical protein